MEEKKLTVTFVNVGYGEAILLECPDSSKPDGVFTALIDGGSAEDSEFADRSSGRVRIEEYLEKRGIRRLDLAVSTHIHEDHLCGLLRAARIAPPAVLWQTLPPDLYRSLRPLDGSVARNLSESKFMQALNDYSTLCALVEDHGGTILAPKSGQELVIAPDLTVQILSPSTKKQLALADEINALYNSANVCSTFLQRLDALDARMNNYSLILRLNYRGTRILLPGDTNVTGYDGIDPADLRADLFKVGHHGQKDGVDEALAELIRPTAVVCCASSDRRYNSAHPDTMNLLRACWQIMGQPCIFPTVPRSPVCRSRPMRLCGLPSAPTAPWTSGIFRHPKTNRRNTPWQKSF